MKIRILLSVLIGMGFAALLACGGSSGSSPGSSPTPLLTGTAAAGAPIDGEIRVAGANGTIVGPFVIAADGTFTVDVSTLTPPYMIEVTGTANGESVTFYTATFETGRINVTPLTDIITCRALGTDITTITQNIPTSIDLSAELQRLLNLLEPILTAFGIETDIDLLRDEFQANGEGIDLLMDLLEFDLTGQRLRVFAQGLDAPIGQIEANGDVTTRPGDQETANLMARRAVRMRARAFANTLETLFSGDSHPTESAIRSALDSYVSVIDLVEFGRSYGGITGYWTAPNPTGPKPGVRFRNIRLLRTMVPPNLPDLIDYTEVGTGKAGIWVSMEMVNGNDVQERLFGFMRPTIRDANTPSNWKWTGNGIPFAQGGNAITEAIRTVPGSGQATHSSGLTIPVISDGHTEIGFTYSDVDTVYALHSVFEEGHAVGSSTGVSLIKLVRNGSEHQWEIAHDGYGTSDDRFDSNTRAGSVEGKDRYARFSGGEDFNQDDLDSFNSEISFVAFSSTNTRVFSGWPDLTVVAPRSVETLSGSPATYFPGIATVQDIAIDTVTTSAIFGGSSQPTTLALSWTNPEGHHTFEITATITTGSTSTPIPRQNEHPLSMVGDWTATSFDLSNITTDSTSGIVIEIRNRAPDGRRYTLRHTLPGS